MAGFTPDQLSEALGMTRRTLSNKINGVTDFTLSEAILMKKLLGRSLDDIFLRDDVA